MSCKFNYDEHRNGIRFAVTTADISDIPNTALGIVNAIRTKLGNVDTKGMLDEDMTRLKFIVSGILESRGRVTTDAQSIAVRVMESLNTGTAISAKIQTIAKVEFGDSNLPVFDLSESIFDFHGAMKINFLEESAGLKEPEESADNISDALSDDSDEVEEGSMSLLDKAKSAESDQDPAIQVALDELDKLKATQLRKQQDKLKEQVTLGQKGMTWGKININLFPGNQHIAEKALSNFQRNVFHRAIINANGTPALKSNLPKNLAALKQEMERDYLKARELLMGNSDISKMTWGQLENFLNNNSSYHDTYINYVMYTVFETMLNHDTLFGGAIEFDAEGTISLREDKIQGEHKQSWENESAISAFDSTNKVSRIIMANTLDQERSTDVRSVSNFIETLNSSPLTKNYINRIIDTRTIGKTHPTIGHIARRFTHYYQSNKTLNKDPKFIALYNRYFNPDEYILNSNSGLKVRSLYRVYTDGRKRIPGTNRFESQSVESRIAEDILTDFTSYLMTTERSRWISVEGGSLNVKSSTNMTKGMLQASLEELTSKFINKKLRFALPTNSSSKIKIRFGTNQDTIELVNVKATEDDTTGIWKLKPGTEADPGQLDKILRELGIPYMRNLSESFISRHSIDGITNFIGQAIRISTLNAQNAIKPDVANFKEFGKKDEYYSQNIKLLERKVIMPPHTLMDDLVAFKDAINDLTDVDTTVYALNDKGEKVMSDGKASALHKIPRHISALQSKISLFHEAKSGAEKWMKHTVYANNPFTSKAGTMALRGFGVKNKVDDKSHWDLGDKEGTLFNLTMFFQSARESEFRSAFFEFFTPSDKKTYMPAEIEMKSGLMPTNKKSLKATYYNTMSNQAKDMLLDMDASVFAEAVIVWHLRGNEKSSALYLAARGKAAKYLSETKRIPVESAIRILESDRDLIRDFLKAERKEKMHIKSAMFLKNSIHQIFTQAKFTDSELASSGLVKNRDYIKRNKGYQANSGMTEWLYINTDEGEISKVLDQKFHEFLRELSEMKIKLDDKSSKIISERYEADVEPKDRLWSTGKISVVMENKEVQINPGLEAFFYANAMATQSLLSLTQGNIFDYDAKTNSLDWKEIMHNSFLTMGKRNVSNTAEYSHPILADVDELGRPINTSEYNAFDIKGNPTGMLMGSRKLPAKVNVIYTDDVEIDVSVMGSGAVKAQEAMDGAIFITPLDVLKWRESYGNDFSSLSSEIIKSFITNRDHTRGINQVVKMAMHQITAEVALNSRGNGKTDMYNILKRMFSRNFPEPTFIEYSSKHDLSKVIEGRKFNNMWEVMQEFAEMGPSGRMDPLHYEHLWKDILEIEYQNPAIANQHTSMLVVNTSVKNGSRKTNGKLSDIGKEVKTDGGIAYAMPIETTQLSLVDSGIQLSANHNFEDTRNSLNAPTQVTSSISNEGRNFAEVTAVLTAIRYLSKHNMELIKELYEGNIAQAVKDDMILSEFREDNYDNFMEKLIQGNWSYDDPDIAKRVVSKLNTIVEKATVRLRMNGGKMTLTPVADIYTMYEVPRPGKAPMMMNRIELEKYIAADGVYVKGKGLTVDSTSEEMAAQKITSRNLHWNTHEFLEGSTAVSDKFSMAVLEDRVSRAEELNVSGATDVAAGIANSVAYHTATNSAKLPKALGTVKFMEAAKDSVTYFADSKSLVKDPDKKVLEKYINNFAAVMNAGGFAVVKMGSSLNTAFQEFIASNPEIIVNEMEIDGEAYYVYKIGDPVVAGMTVRDSAAFKAMERLYKDESPEGKALHKDALAVYNRMLNNPESKIKHHAAEIVLPPIMKKKYHLGVGDNLQEILENENFFFERYKENKVKRGELGVKVTGEPDSLHTMYLRDPDNADIPIERKVYLKKLIKDKANFKKVKGLTESDYDVLRAMRKADKVYTKYYRIHKDFSKSLEGVLPRIPTSGKHSFNAVRVVGFMESLNNAVGIPVDAMVIKGEDFDIDSGYLMIKDQDDQGFLFDYFGWSMDELGNPVPVKNIPGTVPLTKAEIREYLPKDYLKREHAYEIRQNRKYDWYAAGLQNLMVDNIMKVSSDSRNIEESNTPVNPRMLEGIKQRAMANEDKGAPGRLFSLLSPVSVVKLSTINKVGNKMVGVMASSAKAMSAISLSFQTDMLDFKKNHGVLKPHLPRGLKVPGINDPFKNIANLTPVSFFDGLREKHNQDIKRNAESFVQASGIFVKPEDITDEAVMKAMSKHLDVISKSTHSWDFMAGLINASTDNAKELILGYINTNLATGNDIATMIMLGVPIDEIFKLVLSPAAIRKAKQIVDEGLFGSLSSHLSKKDSGLSKPMRDFWYQLSGLTKELQTVAKIAKINQGLNNDAHGMFKYFQDVNKYLKDILSESPNSKKISLQEFVKASPEKRADMIKAFGRLPNVQINVLNVLNNNPHYMEFVNSFYDNSYLVRDEMLNVYHVVEDILTDKDGIQKDGVNEEVYKQTELAVNTDINYQYLHKLGRVQFNSGVFKGTTHDFTTLSGINRFAKSMNSKIESMKQGYDDPDSEFYQNEFISSVVQNSKTMAMGSEPMKYLSSFNEKVGDNTKMRMMGWFRKLEEGTQKALFFYDLIQQSSNMYTATFSKYVPVKLQEGLNEFRKGYYQDYTNGGAKGKKIQDRLKQSLIVIRYYDSSKVKTLPWEEVGMKALYEDPLRRIDQKFIDLSGLKKKREDKIKKAGDQQDPDGGAYNAENAIEDDPSQAIEADQSAGMAYDEGLSKQLMDLPAGTDFEIVMVKTFDPNLKHHVFIRAVVVDYKTHFLVSYDQVEVRNPFLGSNLIHKNYGESAFPSSDEFGSKPLEDQSEIFIRVEPVYYKDKSKGKTGKGYSATGVDSTNKNVTDC